MSAASKAKRLRPDMNVQVFERSGYISYGSCGLPYFVGDLIKDPNELVSLTVEQAGSERGIQTHVHHEVLNIDRQNKTVLVRNLISQEETTGHYDKLIIATGARPIKPDLKGIDSKGVYYLRTVEDGINLKEALQKNGKGAAAIIGGGFIGLEIAENITALGIDVHIIETLPRLLPFLPHEFSEKILDTLQNKGIKVHLNSKAEEILAEDGRVEGLRISDGTTIEANCVVVGVGVAPNSELARDCGLVLGIKGSIAVDDEMRTSDPSIWACGDCVQMINRITGSPVHVPLGTTANKQGRIAGGNAVGNHEIFKGVMGSAVTKVFDLYVAATGLSEKQAQESGYEPLCSVSTQRDRASYYPGLRSNSIALIFDRKSGKLLGAQGIGSESVAGRINVLMTAITCGMTVEEIAQLDLVYAPPVAPVYDPILIAANQAMKALER